ncbi:hypothetical protein LIER_32762 [Lithospermum erythrorhizon]|uniref:Uncharacterized protein n=1 Tax=Lithospermum erythrorhizon TaxID=34254 RepID=A0AAV3RX02_LITER
MGVEDLITNKRLFSKEDESKAELKIWKYIFGFTVPLKWEFLMFLRLKNTLSHSRSCLRTHRIMRFLTFRGIFKEEIIEGGRIYYT